MKKVFYISILFLSLFCTVHAQTDSVMFSNEFTLKEGVYLSYTDFRKNRPVPKDAIESNSDKTQLDFIGKEVGDKKEITVAYNGTDQKIETKNLWGYCQNNTIYLNYEGKFYRVPVFGNISHFLGTVEVYNYNNYGMYGGGMYGYGGMMGGPTMPVKQREMRQFIFDFYSGDIMDYTLHNVEILISRDMKLYEEFMQLKKSKRRDMMMMYVRKYNLSHPVFFPAEK